MDMLPLDAVDDPNTGGMLPLDAVEERRNHAVDIGQFRRAADRGNIPNPVRTSASVVGLGSAAMIDFANTAASSLSALGKAGLQHMADIQVGARSETFIDTFKKEFDNSYSGVLNNAKDLLLLPETKALYDSAGELVHKAVQGYGDAWFYSPTLIGKEPSPILGAIGQAQMMLATFMFGGRAAKPKVNPKAPPLGSLKGADKGIYENWDDPTYVQQWAQATYPETVKNLQASNVGKVIKDEYKAVDAYNKLHSVLNAELGLKDGGGQSLTQKFGGFMDKLDPQQTVPPADRMKIVNSILGQMNEMNKIANAHMTPEQLVAARLIRPEQTPIDVLKRNLNIKDEATIAKETKATKADVKAALAEKHGYVIDPVTSIERPLTAGEYLDMSNAARDQKVIRPTRSKKSKAKPDEVDGTDPSGVYQSDPATGMVVKELTVDEFMAYQQPKGNAILPVDSVPPEVSRVTGRASNDPSTAPAEHIDITAPKESPTIPPDVRKTIADKMNKRAGKAADMERQGGTAKVLSIEDKIQHKKLAPFQKSLSDKISAGVAETKAIIDNYSGWKFEVGDRVKSKKSGRVYEITGKSWNKKINQPMYNYKSLHTKDSESGSFYAETHMGNLGEQVGAHQAMEVLSGPTKGDPTKGPGGKQAGMLLNDTPEAIANNAKAIKELSDKSPNITAAGMLSPERYQEINKAFDAGRAGDPAKAHIPPIKQATDAVTTRMLDTSGPMKHTLEGQGPIAEQAKQRFNLIKGSPGRAQLTYNEYSSSIFKGLSHTESISLDNLIRARRVIAIDQYKGVGKVQHVAKSNGAEMDAFKNNMKAELGAEKFNDLNARADKYFRAMQDQLRALHDNGLVSDESFIAMMNLEYSPTEMLKYIDPERSFTFGGKTVTVRDSGIAEIGRGSNDAVRMDSKSLLAEHILRIQTRIMKNEANITLSKFAESAPDNGFVKNVAVKEWNDHGEALKVGEPPDGWSRIDSVVDGKQQPMFVRNEIAEQWATHPTAITAEFGRFLSIASGTAVVKTLATTVNPTFAMVNLPRDLMHIWSANKEYNTLAPIAALQMGADMLTVAPDAILRKGRYDQFIREGGSQDYMSQQGPASFMGNQLSRMTSSWKPVYNALTYIGATSEAWTRLALRERAIKNGAQPWEASAIAREYLDFSDGGSWVKAADTVMPYLNAATQAIYSTGKQAGRDPVRMTMQATQVLAASVGMATAAMLINQEAWQQIPQDTKLKNFVIAPKDMFVIDPQGNKRYVYFTLPLDGNLVPLNAMGIALTERSLYDKVPDGITYAAMKDTFPLLQGVPIPAISAFATYSSNYDFWRDQNIWKGAKVKPEDEVVGQDKANPTPELYIQLGQQFGMSPERLRASISAVAPRNMYTDLMGGSYQYFMSGTSDAEKSKMTWQLLAENPLLRRTIHLTHPFTAEVDALENSEAARGSVKTQASSAIDMMVFRDANKQGDARSEFRAWIENQPPLERERLTNEFVGKLVVDRVFRQLKTSDGIPSKTWWRATLYADPVVRADVFYQEWVKRTPEQRQQMMRVSGAMAAAGQSYRGEQFERELGLQMKQYGVEQR